MMMAPQRDKNNLRTALILGGVALFFFISVFFKFTFLS